MLKHHTVDDTMPKANLGKGLMGLNPVKFSLSSITRQFRLDITGRWRLRACTHKSRCHTEMSAFGGKAVIEWCCEGSPLLTQGGHKIHTRFPY